LVSIFLAALYDPFIGDLGVAKVLDSSTAFAQSLVGTPYYLSPELCADMPYRDKSDVWAFGVILYEVINPSELF
jgi:NIMA (never in mitosis gene a)-related kinase 1/4/5